MARLFLCSKFYQKVLLLLTFVSKTSLILVTEEDQKKAEQTKRIQCSQSASVYMDHNLPAPLTYTTRSDGTLKFRSKASPLSTTAAVSPTPPPPQRSTSTTLLSPIRNPPPQAAKGTTNKSLDFHQKQPPHQLSRSLTSLDTSVSWSDPQIPSKGGIRSGGSGGVDVSPASLSTPTPAHPSLSLKDVLEQYAHKSRMVPLDEDVQRIADRGMHAIRSVDDPSNVRLSVAPALLGLRESALALEGSLHKRMKDLHMHASSMGRYEFAQRVQHVFSDVMYELIRQIGVQCTERARLLSVLWVRSAEVINALAAMFLQEQERHQAQEAKWKEDLRGVRLDYLRVVERMEKMAEEECINQELMMQEHHAREQQLNEQMDALRESLAASTAEIERLEVAFQQERAQPRRVLPAPESFGIVPPLPSQSSPSSSSTTKKLPSSSSDIPPSSNNNNKGRQPLAVPSVAYATMDPNDLLVLLSQRKPEEIIGELRAELQRQRVLLLDATQEIVRLRGDVPHCYSTATQVDPIRHDVGLDPVEELLDLWEGGGSDDDDDKFGNGEGEDIGSARGRRKGAAGGNRASPAGSPKGAVKAKKKR